MLFISYPFPLLFLPAPLLGIEVARELRASSALAFFAVAKGDAHVWQQAGRVAPPVSCTLDRLELTKGRLASLTSRL